MTERNANGREWRITELTAAQSRAYKRPGKPAPKWQAVGPAGSIIRRERLDSLRAAVQAADWC